MDKHINEQLTSFGRAALAKRELLKRLFPNRMHNSLSCLLALGSLEYQQFLGEKRPDAELFPLSLPEQLE